MPAHELGEPSRARAAVRALLVTGTLALPSTGCRDQVVLGAWGSLDAAGGGGGGSGGSGGSAPSGAGTMTDGGGPELPACLESSAGGPPSSTGDAVGATEVASDWSWPTPVSSLAWDLMIEREIEGAAGGSLPTSGYYFAHQFSFVGGVAGFLGFQDEGGYQQDPPGSPVDFTKMAVFWLSGPPLAGELGDVAYPDARVAPATAGGSSWLTIHARFEWQACRVYRWRLTVDAKEADGSTWYKASIEDRAAGVETVLGRMLLPADIGQLSLFSVTRSVPLDFGSNAACETQAPASAVFGTPSSEDGSVHATLAMTRFVEPFRCTSSRFTELPGAVRHELGLGP